VPLRSPGGVAVVSIGFFLPDRNRALVWRGPMLHKALRQVGADEGRPLVLTDDAGPAESAIIAAARALVPGAVLLTRSPRRRQSRCDTAIEDVAWPTSSPAGLRACASAKATRRPTCSARP